MNERKKERKGVSENGDVCELSKVKGGGGASNGGERCGSNERMHWWRACIGQVGVYIQQPRHLLLFCLLIVAFFTRPPDTPTRSAVCVTRFRPETPLHPFP